MHPIKKLRTRLKISQADLGQEIGVTQSAISQFEKDTAIPSPETVQKIIDFAKKRGVDISFDAIYGASAKNSVIERLAASDDVQPPTGGKTRKRKK
jgi:transcriptional regulator with XRE-family HTH domain